jgi:hypothetical protein
MFEKSQLNISTLFLRQYVKLVRNYLLSKSRAGTEYTPQICERVQQIFRRIKLYPIT